ncbi:MAG: HEAT repeat domain-containing protein [Desulfobacterales bacterium]|nr:HEAT repeat domain-containing protein [Desulfobacterales bacterium]
MGMSADKRQTGGPSNEDLRNIKRVIASFLLTFKNYGLFPETHANCVKCIENTRNSLSGFLKSQDNLRFYVEKEQLLFQNKVVYQQSSKDGNFVPLLFRDGIRWLEFQKGIEEKEITGFFKILKQYKTLREEAEGDIVTALWEENFPHLCYEAREVFWESEPIIDFSLLNVGKEKLRSDKPEDPKAPKSIAASSIDRSLWKLTSEEMRELRRMVYMEENRDGKDDVLDVLVVILEDQKSEDNFNTILEFMKEEFQETLIQAEFQLVFKLLKNLHELKLSYKTERPWAIPLIDNFLNYISEPDVLGILQQVQPGPDEWDSKQVKVFCQILLFLSPEAIHTLVPLLIRISSSRVQRILMDVICSLANRGIRPLEELLDSPDESLVRKVVDILGHLRGKKSTQVLLKTIHHSSEEVRKEAVKVLVGKDPRVLRRLFPLIEDPNKSIRRMMLNYLGQRKNETAEELLLDYLQNRRFNLTGSQHINDCYKVLGKCGSTLSLPFLQDTLLDRGWKSIVGKDKSLDRQRAALALAYLGTREAEEILIKGSRSLFSSVKIACQKAFEERDDRDSQIDE